MTSIDVLDKGYVRLVDHMGDDLSVVNAARVSYDKESQELTDRDRKLLNFLVTEDHTSPFRHAALTFEVYAPLMVARQWWKHAVASSYIDDQNGWNESSRRYVTENEEFYLPTPWEWRSKPENSKQGSGPVLTTDEGAYWSSALAAYQQHGERLYAEALRSGVAPEQARLFLPANGMYVRFRWTVSLAAVMHFLQLRYAHDSQWEIQQYAKAVAELVEPLYPESYKLLLGVNYGEEKG
jgi:thymidylate synthase (FAD)